MAAGDCADRRRRRYDYSMESHRRGGYPSRRCSKGLCRQNSSSTESRRSNGNSTAFADYLKELIGFLPLEDDEEYWGYMERRRENEERKRRREAVAQPTGVKPLNRRGPMPNSLSVKPSNPRRRWRNFPLDAERGRRWKEEEAGFLGRRDHGQPDRRDSSGRETTKNRVLLAAGDRWNGGSEATDEACKESIPLSPSSTLLLQLDDTAIPSKAEVETSSLSVRSNPHHRQPDRRVAGDRWNGGSQAADQASKDSIPLSSLGEANVGGSATVVQGGVALFDNVCVLKTVRGILNKLTQEKFDILKGQLIHSGITSADILKFSEELPEQEIRDKDSLLKLLRLVGLLFKETLVPEETVHDIFKELLGADPKSCPAEEKVEAICQLFSTIGPELDSNPKSRRKNDEYFKRLEDLSTNPQLAPCSRLIHDILALRKWSWVRQDEKSFANWDLPRGDGAMFQSAARVLPSLASRSPSLGTGAHPTLLQALAPAAKSANKGEGITIAIIDSGILLDHHEFTAFDGKVISENVYIEEWKGKDTKGHGSHVASIAAGRICSIAPLSRLRIYKVSDRNSLDHELLYSFQEAMYDAIQKQVGVICISLGDDFDKDFEENIIAKWTCRAAMKGISVCCSAGNAGYSGNSTLENVPPWNLTCGAVWRDDERFEARVELGNQNTLYGHSIYRPQNFSSTHYYKLEYFRPTSCQRLAEEIQKRGRNCITDSIVVLHDHRHISISWKLLEWYGACGLIIINDKGEKSVHCEATINIPYGEGEILIAYMNSAKCSSSKSPSRLTPANARITFSTEKSVAKLLVSKFSSRGPCPDNVPFDTFGVFKPDVLGLGDHILGAFHRDAKKYIWKSGTSMATPYVVAVVARVLAFHPTWSPERVKSAIMTTAIHRGIIDEYDGLPARVFAMGCGLVNLEKALDPGLVYDSIPGEYIPSYLRGLGYSKWKMERLMGEKPVGKSVLLAHNLNYPAFAIQFSATGSAVGLKIRCERIVTNVGETDSSYEVDTDDQPRGVKVHVEPAILIFSPGTTTHKYTVEFELLENLADGISDGSITWKNSKHSVKSPIAVLQKDAQVQHQKHEVEEVMKKARYRSANNEEDMVPLPFQPDELPNCCEEDDTYLEAIIAQIGSLPSDPKDEVEYIKSLAAHLQLPPPDTLEDDDDGTVYWNYMDSLEPSDYRLSDWSDLEPMWAELQKPREERNKNGEPEPRPGCQYFSKPVYPDLDSLRSYCVQLEIPDSIPPDIEEWYLSFFPTVLDSTPEDKRPTMIIACDPNIHCGFFAKLSPKHVEYMKTMPYFMDAQEEGPFQFHLID